MAEPIDKAETYLDASTGHMVGGFILASLVSPAIARWVPIPWQVHAMAGMGILAGVSREIYQAARGQTTFKQSIGDIAEWLLGAFVAGVILTVTTALWR